MMLQRQNPRQRRGVDGMMPSVSAIENAAAVAGEVDQIADAARMRSPPRHLDPDLGQDDPLGAAHELHAQKGLQIANLHGQRRLRSRHARPARAEMAVLAAKL
jgi:hypothetical protein